MGKVYNDHIKILWYNLDGCIVPIQIGQELGIFFFCFLVK